MKKLMLLCVAMVCCMCSFAQAWDNSKPDRRVTFGVKAGLNISNLNGYHQLKSYHDSRTNTSYSFHAGINLDYNISKSFAIETGVFFTDKAFKRDSTVLSENVHLYLIQIPILARFKFYINEDFNIQLRAGGFGAPRIGQRYFDWFLDRKAFEAGLIGGLGFSYKNINLGFQYEYGLTEILKYHGGHTSNIAISLGYDF